MQQCKIVNYYIPQHTVTKVDGITNKLHVVNRENLVNNIMIVSITIETNLLFIIARY